MIPAKQWHRLSWRHVFIVSIMSDRHSSGGVKVVLALPESGADGTWGKNEGMELVVVDGVTSLRIARTRIPLNGD